MPSAKSEIAAAFMPAKFHSGLPTIAPYFLTHVLDSFIAGCPKTRVFVHENTTDQSLQLIESGKLDLGIVSLPIRENGFETETLFSEEMLLAIYPGIPFPKSGKFSRMICALKNSFCCRKTIASEIR